MKDFPESALDFVSMPDDLGANTEEVDIPFNVEEVFRIEEDRGLERVKLSN